MRTAKATPDLMPEANKFETIGVKKIIRNIGNKYIKYLVDLICTK